MHSILEDSTSFLSEMNANSSNAGFPEFQLDRDVAEFQTSATGSSTVWRTLAHRRFNGFKLF
jgi:hypothetical protein